MYSFASAPLVKGAPANASAGRIWPIGNRARSRADAAVPVTPGKWAFFASAWCKPWRAMALDVAGHDTGEVKMPPIAGASRMPQAKC